MQRLFLPPLERNGHNIPESLDGSLIRLPITDFNQIRVVILLETLARHHDIRWHLYPAVKSPILEHWAQFARLQLLPRDLKHNVRSSQKIENIQDLLRRSLHPWPPSTRDKTNANANITTNVWQVASTEQFVEAMSLRLDLYLARVKS